MAPSRPGDSTKSFSEINAPADERGKARVHHIGTSVDQLILINLSATKSVSPPKDPLVVASEGAGTVIRRSS